MAKQITFFLLFAITLAACTPTILTPSTGDIQTAIAQTEAAQPQPSDTPPPSTATLPSEPTITLQPTITATSAGPIDGTVNAAFLNLRAGPGTLFDVLDTFNEGDALIAISRTELGDWVEVEMVVQGSKNQTGWMAVEFLALDADQNILPIFPFSPEQIVSGTIKDDEGNPVSEINVAVIYRAVTPELRQDVFSDAAGDFSLYIPEALTGVLDIQIVGMGCESPVVDENCDMTTYFWQEWRIFLDLPQQEEINFVFAAATLNLEGTVKDEDNQLVDDIVVIGERDDGAQTFTRTNAQGQFSLPIGEGVWQVYTITYQPNREEGERVLIEITDEIPEAVELTAP